MGSKIYHDAHPTEKALIDLLKVGLTGDASGVRQLARRLIRNAPSDVADAAEFRVAVGSVLSSAPNLDSLFRDVEQIPVDGESRQPLVRVGATVALRTPILTSQVAQTMSDIVLERSRSTELAAAGVDPVKSVLFSGPPGVGKTLAAGHLAHELGLPLISVDLASLMSSYLGRTGQNLKAALAFGQRSDCVFLLDEFDALAKRRDDEADVGELKRLVNVLLLELDSWPSTSLLVAATNHPELLDRAVDRRFDMHVTFSLPEENERREMIEAVLADSSDQELSSRILDAIVSATDGYSFSDLERLVKRAARLSLLRNDRIEARLLSLTVAGAPTLAGEERDAYFGLLHEELGYTHRAIATLAGVTHPTVSKAISRWREQSEMSAV